jgi:hypothetical protein
MNLQRRFAVRSNFVLVVTAPLTMERALGSATPSHAFFNAALED